MSRMRIPHGRDSRIQRGTNVNHMAVVAETNLLNFTLRKGRGRAEGKFIEVERMEDATGWS